MIHPPPLLVRWLEAHGADPDAAVSLAAHAVARAHRYPAPVAQVYGPLATLFDRVSPALVGSLHRASSLAPPDLDRLEQRLQHHPLAAVRLAWMLLRAPLVEQLHPDDAPPAAEHPLDALADVVRAGHSMLDAPLDVVVIGSGAGGGPLAWALARSGARVAVIESGTLLRTARADEVLERHFLGQGLLGAPGRGGAAVVLAGRAVGGTTVINSGTSLRPLPEQLRHWDAVWGAGLADGALDPYLDALDARLGVAPVPEDLLDASSRAVLRGLAALGRPGGFPLPRNAPGCQGHGRCCFGCPSGAKQSTDRAFLPDAVRAGAILLTGTTALAVRETPGGVEVWVRTPVGRRRLRARRVVLAAGAVGTPLLLRGSRLGDRWRIAGDHLRIHPATKVWGLMPDALPHGGVPQAVGYHAPELPRVTFEGAHTPPAVTAAVFPLAGAEHRWWLERHDRLANYGLMCRDRATGSVRAVRGGPVLRYPLHPDDARDLAAGARICGEALLAAGAERVVLPFVGARAASRADLASLRPGDVAPGRLHVSGFHPQGTAGIGRVVDADLRVMGTRGVFACDASVLPDSPGVNPQLTVMALSLRLADRLGEV